MAKNNSGQSLGVYRMRNEYAMSFEKFLNTASSDLKNVSIHMRELFNQNTGELTSPGKRRSSYLIIDFGNKNMDNAPHTVIRVAPPKMKTAITTLRPPAINDVNGVAIDRYEDKVRMSDKKAEFETHMATSKILNQADFQKMFVPNAVTSDGPDEHGTFYEHMANTPDRFGLGALMDALKRIDDKIEADPCYRVDLMADFSAGDDGVIPAMTGLSSLAVYKALNDVSTSNSIVISQTAYDNLGASTVANERRADMTEMADNRDRLLDGTASMCYPKYLITGKKQNDEPVTQAEIDAVRIDDADLYRAFKCEDCGKQLHEPLDMPYYIMRYKGSGMPSDSIGVGDIEVIIPTSKGDAKMTWKNFYNSDYADDFPAIAKLRADGRNYNDSKWSECLTEAFKAGNCEIDVVGFDFQAFKQFTPAERRELGGKLAEKMAASRAEDSRDMLLTIGERHIFEHPDLDDPNMAHVDLGWLAKYTCGDIDADNPVRQNDLEIARFDINNESYVIAEDYVNEQYDAYEANIEDDDIKSLAALSRLNDFMVMMDVYRFTDAGDIKELCDDIDASYEGKFSERSLYRPSCAGDVLVMKQLVQENGVSPDIFRGVQDHDAFVKKATECIVGDAEYTINTDELTRKLRVEAASNDTVVYTVNSDMLDSIWNACEKRDENAEMEREGRVAQYIKSDPTIAKFKKEKDAINENDDESKELEGGNLFDFRK